MNADEYKHLLMRVEKLEDFKTKLEGNGWASEGMSLEKINGYHNEVSLLKKDVETIMDARDGHLETLYATKRNVDTIHETLKEIKAQMNKGDEIREVIVKSVTTFNNDFYNGGKGLKYELEEMLKTFQDITGDVKRIFLGLKWLGGIVAGTCIIICATLIVWFISHHWK